MILLLALAIIIALSGSDQSTSPELRFGKSWAAVAPDALQSSSITSSVYGVLPFTGDDWIAVGHREDRTGPTTFRRPAIWAGDDANRFALSRVDAPEWARDAYVIGAAELDDAAIAVGYSVGTDLSESATFWRRGPDNEWRLIYPELFKPDESSRIIGVLTGTSAFFAFATVSRPDEQFYTLLSSKNGVDWERRDTPNSLFTSSSRQWRGFTSSGSRLISAGCSPCGSGAASNPGIWVTDDGGGTWRAASVEPAPTSEGAVINRVAVTDYGVVAVGATLRSDDEARASVWISPDGSKWTRETLIAGDRPNKFSFAYEISSVAGKGIIIIGNGDRKPIAWALRDGVWSDFSLPDAFVETVIAGREEIRVSADEKWVVITGDRSGGPVLWRSEWSSSWEEIDPGGQSFSNPVKRIDSYLVPARGNPARVVRRHHATLSGSPE